MVDSNVPNLLNILGLVYKGDKIIFFILIFLFSAKKAPGSIRQWSTPEAPPGLDYLTKTSNGYSRFINNNRHI